MNIAQSKSELVRGERLRGPGGRAVRKLLGKPKAIFGIGVILLLYGGGVFAGWLAPYGYDEQNLLAVRQGPSFEHLFGTDWVGRTCSAG